MRHLLVALVMVSASVGFSAEGGLTSAPLLQRAWGAHAPGVAGAFTAARGSLESVGYNPAGLVGVTGHNANVMFNAGYAGDSSGYLAYGQPLGPGAVALGVAYLSGGDIALNFSSGAQETRKAQKDYLYVLTYALPVGHGLAVGASGKLMTSDLAQEASASVSAFDLGVTWESPVERLEFGASVLHLGGKLQYEVAQEELPRQVRVGVGYSIPLRFLNRRDDRFDLVESGDFVGDDLYDMRISGDYVSQNKADPEVALGLEFRRQTSQRISGFDGAARLGYVINRPFQSIAAGFGMAYHGGLSFDYALGLAQELSATHRFLLKFKF